MHYYPIGRMNQILLVFIIPDQDVCYLTSLDLKCVDDLNQHKTVNIYSIGKK